MNQELEGVVAVDGDVAGGSGHNTNESGVTLSEYYRDCVNNSAPGGRVATSRFDPAYAERNPDRRRVHVGGSGVNVSDGEGSSARIGGRGVEGRRTERYQTEDGSRIDERQKFRVGRNGQVSGEYNIRSRGSDGAGSEYGVGIKRNGGIGVNIGGIEVETGSRGGGLNIGGFRIK